MRNADIIVVLSSSFLPSFHAKRPVRKQSAEQRVRFPARIAPSLPSALLPHASRDSQTLPPTTIPGMSSIGPTRRLAPMREDHRIDNLATIDTAPSFELESARIVSKIHEAIWHHQSLTTLAIHGIPSIFTSSRTGPSDKIVCPLTRSPLDVHVLPRSVSRPSRPPSFHRPVPAHRRQDSPACVWFWYPIEEHTAPRLCLRGGILSKTRTLLPPLFHSVHSS